MYKCFFFFMEGSFVGEYTSIFFTLWYVVWDNFQSCFYSYLSIHLNSHISLLRLFFSSTFKTIIPKFLSWINFVCLLTLCYETRRQFENWTSTSSIIVERHGVFFRGCWFDSCAHDCSNSVEVLLWCPVIHLFFVVWCSAWTFNRPWNAYNVCSTAWRPWIQNKGHCNRCY